MTRTWTKPMQWQNKGTEPSEALKQSGFTGGYKPAAGTFNYFLHREQVCIEELQSAIDKIDTNLDCGYFDGYTPVSLLAYHVAAVDAHQNLTVDGNSETEGEVDGGTF